MKLKSTQLKNPNTKNPDKSITSKCRLANLLLTGDIEGMNKTFEKFSKNPYEASLLNTDLLEEYFEKLPISRMKVSLSYFLAMLFEARTEYNHSKQELAKSLHYYALSGNHEKVLNILNSDPSLLEGRQGEDYSELIVDYFTLPSILANVSFSFGIISEYLGDMQASFDFYELSMDFYIRRGHRYGVFLLANQVAKNKTMFEQMISNLKNKLDPSANTSANKDYHYSIGALYEARAKHKEPEYFRDALVNYLYSEQYLSTEALVGYLTENRDLLHQLDLRYIKASVQGIQSADSYFYVGLLCEAKEGLDSALEYYLEALKGSKHRQELREYLKSKGVI